MFKFLNNNFMILFSAAAVLILVNFAKADDGHIRRPLKGQGPTKIYVAIGLLDIDEIDSANQSFVANVYFEIRWYDSRLKHSGVGRKVVPMNSIWHPQLLFVNQQKIWPTFPEVAHISPGGEVTYRQRVWGPFSQPLDVQNFPFDKQNFEIRIAFADETTNELQLVSDTGTTSGIADKFSLPDWKVLKWEIVFNPYKPTGSSEDVASFALVLYAARFASHFIWKVILPLILIVAMSWVVFWIDPSETGAQIGVGTTSMLTLIAYRFVVEDMVPTVPYLTRIDYFILGSTLLVFAALLQVVITSRLAKTGRLKIARKIDVWCRFIFPGIFICITYLSLVS